MHFRGTTLVQDGFYQKNKKKETAKKFPEDYNTPVDMRRVNADIIRKWITDEITALQGEEDDITVEYCISQLQGDEPDPKELQLSLEAFLGPKNGKAFTLLLWQHLVSAQANPAGVSQLLINTKKKEIDTNALALKELQNEVAQYKQKEEKPPQPTPEEEEEVPPWRRPTATRKRKFSRDRDTRERSHRRNSRESKRPHNAARESSGDRSRRDSRSRRRTRRAG